MITNPKDEPQLVEGGPGRLAYRVRAGSDPHVPPILLIHGFGGDENVLWVVQSALPDGGFMAAPRGPYPAGIGGFAWRAEDVGPTGSISDLGTGVDALAGWVKVLTDDFGVDEKAAVLVGFSQGSALAFSAVALGAVHPFALVALAAYLPEGDLVRLRGIPVFWGHGTLDDKVPAQRAREDVARLEAAGAAVTYCEAEVGHKVGVECMRGLKRWLRDLTGEDRSR